MLPYLHPMEAGAREKCLILSMIVNWRENLGGLRGGIGLGYDLSVLMSYFYQFHNSDFNFKHKKKMQINKLKAEGFCSPPLPRTGRSFCHLRLSPPSLRRIPYPFSYGTVVNFYFYTCRYTDTTHKRLYVY